MSSRLNETKGNFMEILTQYVIFQQNLNYDNFRFSSSKSRAN